MATMTAKPRGRPTLPDSERRAYTVRVRVTAAEEAKYRAIGGDAWFRKSLKRAKTPRKFDLPHYPIGEIAGPCLCGNLPNGYCLQCT